MQAQEKLLREQLEMIKIVRERALQMNIALNRANAFELLNRESKQLDHDDIEEILEE